MRTIPSGKTLEAKNAIKTGHLTGHNTKLDTNGTMSGLGTARDMPVARTKVQAEFRAAQHHA